MAEAVYALLAARSAGLPPAAVLPKYHDALTPTAYTSLLVALGRKELWDTSAAVAAWVRSRGMELPAVGPAGRGRDTTGTNFNRQIISAPPVDGGLSAGSGASQEI